MSRILGCKVLFPPRFVTQARLSDIFVRKCRQVVSGSSGNGYVNGSSSSAYGSGGKGTSVNGVSGTSVSVQNLLPVFDRIPSIFRNTQIRGRWFFTDPELLLSSPSASLKRMDLGTTTDNKDGDAIENMHNRFHCQLTKLARDVSMDVLEQCQLHPTQIDHFISVTEFPGCPPLDASIGRAIGLRDNVIYTPLTGLGCAGGAVGLSTAMRYLKQFPQHAVLLNTAEHSSRIWEADGDLRSILLASANTSTFASDSASNSASTSDSASDSDSTSIHQKMQLLNRVIVSALMGDGAASVVLTGAKWHRHQPNNQYFPTQTCLSAVAPTVAPVPVLVDSTSLMLPLSTLPLVGTRVHSTGVRMFLHPDIPRVAAPWIRQAIDTLLNRHGYNLSNIQHWIVHPGSPKVLSAIAETCGLVNPSALSASYDALHTAGNCMSVSVLQVLHNHLSSSFSTTTDQPSISPSSQLSSCSQLSSSILPTSRSSSINIKQGDKGIVAAVGPGMRVEALLVHFE